jgi:hypothetical protein
MMANVSLFEDGTVDMHMPPDMTPDLKAWILQMMDRVRGKIVEMPCGLKVRLDT